MCYHHYSLLREWSLLDKKLCFCITSQCMDGKLSKTEMPFFREAQTSMFGLDHPIDWEVWWKSAFKVSNYSQVLRSGKRVIMSPHVCVMPPRWKLSIISLFVTPTNTSSDWPIPQTFWSAHLCTQADIPGFWCKPARPGSVSPHGAGAGIYNAIPEQYNPMHQTCTKPLFVALTTIWPKYPISPRSLWRPLVALGWAIYKAFLKVAFQNSTRFIEV